MGLARETAGTTDGALGLADLSITDHGLGAFDGDAARALGRADATAGVAAVGAIGAGVGAAGLTGASVRAGSGVAAGAAVVGADHH